MYNASRIVLGFHACVDYELNWSTQVVNDLIVFFDIKYDEVIAEIEMMKPLVTERDLFVRILQSIIRGVGGEIIPTSNEAVVALAERFDYEVTIGGTAARAAMAVSDLGMPCTLLSNLYNDRMGDLMPDDIKIEAIVHRPKEETYPHVVLQYPEGAEINVKGHIFRTDKHNRVLFTHDPDGINYLISSSMGKYASEADVFLVSSFSEVLDKNVIESRVQTVVNILNQTPKECVKIYEHAHYVNPEFENYVLRNLIPHVDVMSMNEEELQVLIGKSINLQSVDGVAAAIQSVLQTYDISRLLIHTANWCLLVGIEGAEEYSEALELASDIASYRYFKGDDFTLEEFIKSKEVPLNQKGKEFLASFKDSVELSSAGSASRNFDSNFTPTTVGLGDRFVGGFVAGVYQSLCNKEA